jgi:polyisoprenoid-binding protein YceI
VFGIWWMSAVWIPVAVAQPRAIDVANSTMTVRVSKAGVLSALGHNHEISAPIAAGTVDATAHTVEFKVEARTLQARDPENSEKDRSQTQTTMLGPEVLDVTRYPEIAFRSTAAEQGTGGAWKVQGNLTLHGQTRMVTVDVRETGGHYEGSARLKQTDFGMKPVKAGGGTVKVKDEVVIEFKIQTTH